MKQKPPSDDREDICAGHAHGFPVRSSLGFSLIEDITLDLFRCVCDIYASGSGQPWNVAMDMAEARMGIERGPFAVSLVTALVRAMLAERKEKEYAYLGSGCLHVSPDERVVTELLRAARAGDLHAEARLLQNALGNCDSTERTQCAVGILAGFQMQYMDPADDGELAQPCLRAAFLH